MHHTSRAQSATPMVPTHGVSDRWRPCVDRRIAWGIVVPSDQDGSTLSVTGPRPSCGDACELTTTPLGCLVKMSHVLKIARRLCRCRPQGYSRTGCLRGGVFRLCRPIPGGLKIVPF